MVHLSHILDGLVVTSLLASTLVKCVPVDGKRQSPPSSPLKVPPHQTPQGHTGASGNQVAPHAVSQDRKGKGKVESGGSSQETKMGTAYHAGPAQVPTSRDARRDSMGRSDTIHAHQKGEGRLSEIATEDTYERLHAMIQEKQRRDALLAGSTLSTGVSEQHHPPPNASSSRRTHDRREATPPSSTVGNYHVSVPYRPEQRITRPSYNNYIFHPLHHHPKAATKYRSDLDRLLHDGRIGAELHRHETQRSQTLHNGLELLGKPGNVLMNHDGHLLHHPEMRSDQVQGIFDKRLHRYFDGATIHPSELEQEQTMKRERSKKVTEELQHPDFNNKGYHADYRQWEAVHTYNLRQRSDVSPPRLSSSDSLSDSPPSSPPPSKNAKHGSSKH